MQPRFESLSNLPWCYFVESTEAMCYYESKGGETREKKNSLDRPSGGDLWNQPSAPSAEFSNFVVLHRYMSLSDLLFVSHFTSSSCLLVCVLDILSGFLIEVTCQFCSLVCFSFLLLQKGMQNTCNHCATGRNGGVVGGLWLLQFNVIVGLIREDDGFGSWFLTYPVAPFLCVMLTLQLKIFWSILYWLSVDSIYSVCPLYIMMQNILRMQNWSLLSPWSSSTNSNRF